MMKFFRKHNKKLLAVFMAALLVVWLGGSALTAMLQPTPGTQVIATSKYGDIVGLDQQSARASTEVLESFGIPWSTLGLDPRAWPAEEPWTVMDFLLARREAEHMGLRPTEAELEIALESFGLEPERLNQIAAQRDRKPEFFRRAFSDFFAINNMQNLVTNAALPSEAEVRLVSRNMLETVEIEAIVLRAFSFIDTEGTFSEDELQAHFEKYRESEPVSGTMTFGYYQPPRVNVQYVQISPEAIAESLDMPEPELDRKAKDFWRRNKKHAAFRRVTTMPAVDPETTQPTTSDVEIEYPENYPEAEEAARQWVKRREAQQIADNMALWLSNQFSEPFFEVRPGPDGFREAPDRVKYAGEKTEQPGYVRSVIEKMPPGMNFPDAIDVNTTGFFAREQTWLLGGLANARVDLGQGRAYRLPQLAFNVRGLVELPEDRRELDQQLLLAKHQFSPLVLRDMSDNRYLFRVVEIEEAHAPESLDVVRERVVDDLRLLHAYERAKDHLEDLKAKAEQRDGKLGEAWQESAMLQEKATGPMEGYIQPPPFARQNSQRFRAGIEWQSIDKLGRVDDDFIQACFELGEQPGERPKMKIMEMPRTSRVALVRWIDTTPMSREEYLSQRESISGQLMLQRRMAFLATWVAPENIRKRCEFEPVRREREEEEDAETTGAEQPTGEPSADDKDTAETETQSG